MTATELIQQAFRDISVLAQGQTLAAADLQVGYNTLKELLRYWSAKRLMIPFTTKSTLTLTGAQSYTIGSGGVFNETRPRRIIRAVVNDTGIDRAIEVVDAARYQNLTSKGTVAPAEILYYDPQYLLGVIYIYPCSSGTLYLYSLKPFTEPLVAAETLYDPMYDPVIEYNLAVWLAPKYNREALDTVKTLAQSTFDTIQSFNLQDQLCAIHSELATGDNFDINEG